jgi:hypothetical protein
LAGSAPSEAEWLNAIEVVECDACLPEDASQRPRGHLAMLWYDRGSRTGSRTTGEFDMTAGRSDFGESCGQEAPAHLAER